MLVFELEVNNGMEQKAKTFRDATKDAMVLACRLWHSNMLPRHFRTGAAQRYAYASRGQRYQRYKRKIGSPPALVFSGASRDLLTGAMNFNVTYSQDKAVGRFIVGNQIRYFWMTPANHPNKPQEMKKTPADEAEALAEFVAKHVGDKVNNPKAVQKVTIQ